MLFRWHTVLGGYRLCRRGALPNCRLVACCKQSHSDAHAADILVVLACGLPSHNDLPKVSTACSTCLDSLRNRSVAVMVCLRACLLVSLFVQRRFMTFAAAQADTSEIHHPF